MKALAAGSFALAVVALLALGCSEKKKKSPADSTKTTEATTRGSEARDRPALQQPDSPAGAPTKVDDDELRDKRAQYRSKQLAAYDKDGDGQFSPEERQAMVEERIDRTFSELDKNGDDRLGKHEVAGSDARMARRLERRFDKLDADGDGVLTREETKKLMTGRRFGPGAGKPAPGGSTSNPGQ